MPILTQKHHDTLDTAIRALHGRTFFAAFPENPSSEIYGPDADRLGREAFERQRDQHFTELLQTGAQQWVGQEESPYEQLPLGVQYPYFAPEVLVERAQASFERWRKLKPA